MSLSNGSLGTDLAQRLGLKLKIEGHDLAGPCIACKSSDAFRLHRDKGIAHCFSCGRSWSGFQVAETVLGDRERAKLLFVELGIFQPSSNGDHSPTYVDPIDMIAFQKGVTAEAFRAYGATTYSAKMIHIPAFGPDGMQCSTFTLSTDGGKGLFAKGKPAGLFFPHEDGKVRLPKPGEVWHLVEGPKDAAALWSLGLLACGLNTCRLNVKFARLFAGVNVVFVPDRDAAGEEGAKQSSRGLRGHAKTVRIAVLPAEFKESGGDDVRDILKRPEGREQLELAIKDAKPPKGWTETGAARNDKVSSTVVEIPLPDGDPLKLEVGSSTGKPQRLVVVTRGEVQHRDRIDFDSARSREQFFKKAAAKLKVDVETLTPLIESELPKQAAEADKDCLNFSSGDKDDSQATIAVQMAAAWERWHSPADKGYVTLPNKGHQEIWPVKSQTFKRMLSKRFFDEQETVMNSDSINAAISAIDGQARFDGEEHEVQVRIAECEGSVFVDLCNPEWEVIEINSGGWSVVPEPPVRFRRSSGMQALPMPESCDDINLLREFLNVDDDAWVLLVCWLVAAYRPHGPYPILALFAEQGCGKSTIGRFVRSLVDPNASPLRAEPRDARDLMIAANNSWVIAFDNLSYVPTWLSDALCRLSTGGGFSTRELYTDDDEVIFDSQRPVMLTSIEEVATRSDLLDRCLIVTLSPIPDDKRRTEAELNAAFEKVRPRIIGALLRAVSIGLGRLAMIRLDRLPRLADFAVWASACETAFGWAPGTFIAAYDRNRESANDVALESSVISKPLLTILDEQGEWNGTSSELLTKLEGQVPPETRRDKAWPKNARSLSGHLKRLAPNLRTAGWSVEYDRSSKARCWLIRRNDANRSAEESASSFASSNGECNPTQTDANSDLFDSDDASDANDADPGTSWNPDRF